VGAERKVSHNTCLPYKGVDAKFCSNELLWVGDCKPSVSRGISLIGFCSSYIESLLMASYACA
jgi:hypothetical protein